MPDGLTHLTQCLSEKKLPPDEAGANIVAGVGEGRKPSTWPYYRSAQRSRKMAMTVIGRVWRLSVNGATHGPSGHGFSEGLRRPRAIEVVKTEPTR